MKKIRVIPRLDVKGPNVVKGINLEGLRVVGSPTELAKEYYEQGADEILYMDIVASLYERNNLSEIVEKTTSSGIFIPITVGGGIRNIEDIKKILRSGADKVAINTGAVKNKNFIKEAAKIFGSQCIVGSIEAKQISENKWEAYIDNGRERTGLDAIEWAKELEKLGIGELLITSVDKEGLEKGYDTKLITEIVKNVKIPVIASGGAKDGENVAQCLTESNCDGASMASILHYKKTKIQDIKEHIKNKKDIRNISSPSSSTENAKKRTVSIVDYNAGNLKSVITAFETLGHNVQIINDYESIINAELLVIPGDGAFGYGMEQLKQNKLDVAIKKYANSGKPLLGICLGMQLLMDSSEEFGNHNGLGLISGHVKKIEPKYVNNQIECSVPHMGWGKLTSQKDYSNTIFKNIEDNSEAYFVHSFCVMLNEKKYSLANTTYADQEFCTVVHKDNIYGTQFHPEKSGSIGIEILKAFCNL